MNLLESKFIPLNEACETVIGEGCHYPPIDFLAQSHLYDDIMGDLHVAGSITTPNPRTMGDCGLSYKLQSLHNRKVRLPARTRRIAKRISRYQDTNLHSCISSGLLDLTTLGQDARTWYKFTKAAAGSNFDIVAKTSMPREVANRLLFERLGSFLESCNDHGSTLSLVDNGRTTYIHYHSTYYPRSQHFNIFLFEGSHLDPWNTTRSSRKHQVRKLTILENVPGYYTDPQFYSQPGTLEIKHETLGAHLVDAAKEVRLAVTNPPHQIDFSSFVNKIPSNLEISASQESMWLGNLVVAMLENEGLTWTLLKHLDLIQYLNQDLRDQTAIINSMSQADAAYFKYPKRPIYPNSPIHRLEQLAPLITPLMTMPFSEFQRKSLHNNKPHQVLNHRYFYSR